MIDGTQDARTAQRWLDKMAIGLSGLCVVHCVATVLLAAALASIGSVLLDPRVHEIGLALALGLAALGLGIGIVRHGRPLPLVIGGCGLALMAAGLMVPHGLGEAALSIAGVGLVALGHYRNGRALAEGRARA